MAGGLGAHPSSLLGGTDASLLHVPSPCSCFVLTRLPSVPSCWPLTLVREGNGARRQMPRCPV